MDPKHKLEKQKYLVEMELAADAASDAYEEGGSVYNNEVEAEIQDEQEAAWVAVDVVGMRDLKKSEAPTINEESSPLSIVVLCFTAVREEAIVGGKSNWVFP
jgi:hypothetical protein